MRLDDAVQQQIKQFFTVQVFISGIELEKGQMLPFLTFKLLNFKTFLDANEGSLENKLQLAGVCEGVNCSNFRRHPHPGSF